MAASLAPITMNHGPNPAVHPFFTSKAVRSEQHGGHLQGNGHVRVAETVHNKAADSPSGEAFVAGARTDLDDMTGQSDAAQTHEENGAGAMGTDIEMQEARVGPRKASDTPTIAWPISSKPPQHQSKRQKVHHEGHVLADSIHLSADHGASDKLLHDDRKIDEAAGKSDGNISKDVNTATPPRKMLKLNASGTLGSPQMPRTAIALQDVQAKSGTKKRGRPKRSLVAICRYPRPSGGDAEVDFGALISAILSGEHTHVPKPATPKPAPSVPKKAKPLKATHPFFSGPPKKAATVPAKAEDDAQKTSPARTSHRKSFASTPGKMRLQVAQMKSASGTAPPTFGGHDRAQPRSNNAKDEVWPGPGMLHIRDLGSVSLRPVDLPRPQSRKKKLASSAPDQSSSFFEKYSPRSLEPVGSEPRTREDGFLDPHPSLRVPARSLLTGTEILASVLPQLSPNHALHAAPTSLARSIVTHLTAYDHGRGESLPWTQKYAPTESLTVLQPGIDATILRDWMKLLAVNAVGGSAGSNTKAALAAMPRKKRRKRAEELDDFVVSSGDEDDRLGALSGLEELGSQGSQGSRTLVRSAPDNSTGEAPKLANAVILSGPHGCGKTAMVMAVAKELNYQVFEINPGSKRSGREVLERIGDVIANHIVSRDRQDSGNASGDEDSRISAAFNRDLESGRQGTMKSFFTAGPAKKAAPKVAKQVAINAVARAIKVEPSRQQKQSIILLEEVDILFEEDKGFWSTIVSLLATSKRPVVMTCTDEYVLPMEELLVHAILRLSSPPIELAVDYLLLIAAQEGHLLSRASVNALYRSKHEDLRASLTDLQFWCQMGIGDPRGGLSWIFQRWPPGTGVDANGDTQRVVSTGTYHANMGCFPCEREGLTSTDMIRETLMEAWTDWSLDPRDEAHVRLPDAIAGQDFDVAIMTSQQRLDALRQVSRFTETLSALDLQCQVANPGTSLHQSRFTPLGSSLKQPMDTTQPKITPKLKESFTERPALVQADEAIDYTQLNRDIAVAICALLPEGVQSTHPKSRISTLIQERNPYKHFEATPTNELYGALEPLAEIMTSSGNYTSLVLPLSTITTEIAPYVRSIATHDQQRRSLYADLGGKRKTRAARGAVEGRGRGGVRRERWWDCELDSLGVTAGVHMLAAGARAVERCAADRAPLDEDMTEER